MLGQPNKILTAVDEGELKGGGGGGGGGGGVVSLESTCLASHPAKRPCQGKFRQATWAKKKRQRSNEIATND